MLFDINNHMPRISELPTGTVTGAGLVAVAQGASTIQATIGDIVHSGATETTGAVSKYSTGWTQTPGGTKVENGSTHTITHNLGTTDVQVAVYVKTVAAATTVTQVGVAGGSYAAGAVVTSLNSDSITLQLSDDGYISLDTTGKGSSAFFTHHFMKVIVTG